MNLLPQNEIKIIKRESTMRLIIVVSFLILFLEMVAFFMLVPSYVLVRAERNTLFSSVDQIKNTVTGKGSADEELKIVGKDIKDFLLNEKISDNRVTSIINSVLTLRPKGITTNNISVSAGKDNSELRMSGIGETREALIEFQRILSSQDFVKEAKYSERFIMKKSNINYNLVITLK